MSKMQKTQAIVPEEIHLLKIHVFKSNLETSEAFLNNPTEIEGFTMGFFHEKAHNLEENRVRIRLHVTLDGVNEKEENMGLKGEYGIEFHYMVENMKNFIQNDGDSTQISLELGATLIGMSFSTARGIILERTQGTFFNGVILPIIDVTKVLTNEQHI